MPDILETLQKEYEQAKAGTHQRQRGEEKRLLALKAQKVKRAEQTLLLRVSVVDARFEEQRREVRLARRPLASVSHAIPAHQCSPARFNPFAPSAP